MDAEIDEDRDGRHLAYGSVIGIEVDGRLHEREHFLVIRSPRPGVDTPYVLLAVYMFVFGAGLGLTMQVVVTAVQNSVDRRHMGTATASVGWR